MRKAEDVTYNKWLRAGFAQPQQNLRDLVAVYSYFRGGCREEKAGFFSEVHSDRSRGNRHKMGHRKFLLYIGLFNLKNKYIFLL